ncbi:uncharacterized protein LOC122811395 isoform X2 [Protopterus annectens]|uniref:uncharacterized protein LOC122811395 isoform X2 n=1 Tax=Protopterus annectens TaxID=7888 RepID=UPI001CF963A3|nr:uncharacterized protein LOC122811395 isoform X2 [Protopterus annectens]
MEPNSSVNDVCRICHSKLKGNQRKWIFGQTGKINFQVVLSHVLGHQVTRDGGEEFLCSKCVFMLERVFRFDTVIARVQALSIEKLQRLLTEKDKVIKCLSHLYSQYHALPQSPQYKGQDITVDIVRLPHVQYNMLLQDDMAFSEYECWSERTGERCHDPNCQRKNCFSCNVLKVPDSAYESVCGKPRRLPRSGSCSPVRLLSKSKSQSMPLDWLRSPDRTPSIGSYRSSTNSFFGDGLDQSSRSYSNLSLSTISNSDKDDDPFDLSPCLSPHYISTAIHQIKDIEYRPVSTPPTSKIPVRRNRGRRLTASAPRTPEGHLNFNGKAEDFTELVQETIPDDFLPMSQAKFLEGHQKYHHMLQVIRQLNGQLEKAQAQIRALQESRPKEKKLRFSDISPFQEEDLSSPTVQHEGTEKLTEPQFALKIQKQEELIGWLTKSLQEKERTLQECLNLIIRLKPGTESLEEVKNSLTEKLQERLKQRDKALEELRSLISQKDCALQQLETMCKNIQQAARDQEKRYMYISKEKDAIIAALQEALHSSGKDVEALSDSLIGQGLDAPDSPPRLCLQLKDKERLLAKALLAQNEQLTVHQQQVQELQNAVTIKEKVEQEQLECHKQALLAKSQEIQQLRNSLRLKEQAVESQTKDSSAVSQGHYLELAQLSALLNEKDHMLVKFLEEGQEKDRLIQKLQEYVKSNQTMEVKPAL